MASNQIKTDVIFLIFVISEDKDNFHKYKSGDAEYLGEEYDKKSIMQYGK